MNKLDLEETTRRFHNVYEQVAKEYGYKTREDTKELDFNSPNGMTMLKTVETIITPYLEEIERLTISLQAQEELTMTWYKKVKNARDLFYEKCRISQNGIYTFNEIDYKELSDILGSDKE